MPGMPFSGQGGQFGGARYGWGDVPGAGGRSNANSGSNQAQFTNSPEAGLHRAEWQWRGHAPDAQRSYGWDYQGSVGRDEISQRTEARMGSSFQARMAQERSGGLPQGRYAIDYDRGRRTGGGDVSYDWGWQGRTGGMDRYGSDYRGGMQGGGYGNDVRGGYGASGGGFGSGTRQGGGYGRDFGTGRGFSGGGYGAERGGFGGRQPGGNAGGGYGARGYDRGMRGSMGGGYGRGDYSHPLSDADFFRRVERW